MTTQKGTIVKWNQDRNFGFIQPEETRGRDEQIFMHRSATTLPSAKLREGTKVEFETSQGKKGLRAENVRLPGKEIPPKGYRFINPYNFVRYLPKRELGADASIDMKLLGRVAPTTHDRWLGLTGEIECQLKAVTPLFVSDAEGVDVVKEINDRQKHYKYRFFQIDGKKAIPASSLRGMIRSIFEAVTNSAFSNLNGDRLSYRLPPDEMRKLVPGRLEKQEDGSWRLRLLPGVAYFEPENPQKKGLYGSPAAFYKPLERSRRFGPAPEPIPDKDKWAHRKPYWAVLREGKLAWRALALANSEKEAQVLKQQLAKKGLHIQHGWLCRTGHNTPNKHSERFFFRDSKQANVPEVISVDNEVVGNYLDLIRDYQTRHAKNVQKGVGPEKDRPQLTYSWFVDEKKYRRISGIEPHEKLRVPDGELVYARIKRKGNGNRVVLLAPVSWPRVAYGHKVSELLPPHLHKESDGSLLDPASRVFGWVQGEKEGEGAYAGRVKFSHAFLQPGKSKEVKEMTLAILGSPKPTTTRFYLVNRRTGRPQNGRSAQEAGYDGYNKLRGRKMYRHFMPDEKHMLSDDRSDQNRTIQGAEGAGAKFTFKVRFENLAPVELGALLWSLTLGGKGYHKVGYGKPLGFGSAEITITNVSLYDLVARYRSLKSDGLQELSEERQAALITRFQEVFCRYYVANPEVLKAAQQRGAAAWKIVFEDLPNVSDLLTLLSKDAPELPVHYPFSSDPASQGQFEWFVGNHRYKKGPRIELPLPSDDEGLPLMDKMGNIH